MLGLERSSLEQPLLSQNPTTQGIEIEHDNDFTDVFQVDAGELGTDQKFGGTNARMKLEHSLVRKLDRRMSILILIYILNHIDRNNASVARLYGFEDDLKLEGNQFASILSILYVGYIMTQVPSNMLLVYIGKPSVYLSSCMMIWGCVSFATGLTTSFLGALYLRFILGFVEATFFPGALFLISKWYKRDEISQRTALLFCGGLISNAFGSLIASGLLDILNGLLGYSAWRWLFFVEGSLTVIVAACSIFVLPDFPESHSTWLTPAETALAMHRMAEDAAVNPNRTQHINIDSTGKPDRENSQTELWTALTDWKVWWLAITGIVLAICLSFNAFFPTLSATMGYNNNITLLLCAPPWVLSTITTVIVSRHSDRIGERYWHIFVPLLVAVSGFLLGKSTMNTGVRYLSLFLMVQAYAGYVCFLAWASGSISRQPSHRAIGLAIINCGTTIGNMAGSYVWPSSWGPSYSDSYSICILTAIVTASMCFVFRRHLRSRNVELGKAGDSYRYLL